MLYRIYSNDARIGNWTRVTPVSATQERRDAGHDVREPFEGQIIAVVQQDADLPKQYVVRAEDPQAADYYATLEELGG